MVVAAWSTLLLATAPAVALAYVGGAAPAPQAAAARARTPCMDGKIVMYGDAARKALIDGVDQVANAVKVTLGPRGRNVVIQDPPQGGKFGDPRVVNDGVTIAENIVLSLPEENVGAALLLQAAQQTDSRAGDGTTTSTVLTQAIVKAGLKLVQNGANSVALQKGLNKAAAFFVEEIRGCDARRARSASPPLLPTPLKGCGSARWGRARAHAGCRPSQSSSDATRTPSGARSMASPVDKYEQYASIGGISSGSEEMGATVADAIFKVGYEGSTTVELGRDIKDTIEFTDGMEHEVGWLNERFVKVTPSPNPTLTLTLP
eukprot:3207453-Prymnesium_polylepis.1